MYFAQPSFCIFEWRVDDSKNNYLYNFGISVIKITCLIEMLDESGIYNFRVLIISRLSQQETAPSLYAYLQCSMTQTFTALEFRSSDWYFVGQWFPLFFFCVCLLTFILMLIKYLSLGVVRFNKVNCAYFSYIHTWFFIPTVFLKNKFLKCGLFYEILQYL